MATHRSAVAALLLAAAAAVADDKPAKEPRDTASKTHHKATIDGKEVPYTATAGTLVLREEDGKARASIFYVAYERTVPPAEQEKQPLTFCFNGGPGSSSVWLHLGAFGPKRVLLQDSGEPTPPPYRLVNNELGILDLTDLVFIDPPTTGYSRAAPGQDAKQFHGVQQDLDVVGDFVRLYLTRAERWGSPKFLAGESYGTTRAAGLTLHLQDRHGISLNGVLLISAVLNFETIRFDDGNDLPYPLFLPGYTATAWYHKKLPAELQGDLKKALAESEKFAESEYTVALMKGARLSAAEQVDVARKLARLTGLSEDYVLRSNLRVEAMRFMKELLRAERKTTGRFDSRLLGDDSDAVGERHEHDPSYDAVQGAYTATLNRYLRDALKYESDLPYEILTGRVQPWDFGSARNRYLNAAPSLRQAMLKNAALRLFVASGYYDLATPYFGTQYTLDHLGLPKDRQANVTHKHYEAGHMMYIHKASHEQLRRDVAAFYREASGAK
jgi:carboxypeptidase C (cathepsin A)